MGETVTTALTTAFTQIKTDVLDGVATALPYALAIGVASLQFVSAGASLSLLLAK